MKIVSLRVVLSVLFLAGLGFWGTASVVSAHDLVPLVLVQYVQEHPNASAAEIEAYAENTVPAYAEKFPNGNKVFEVVKNQSTNPFDTLWDFFKLGVNHILSGPDHILFVISLLLVFVSMKDILKLTGTFTVAHSLTLILSTIGAISLSSRIVEPMIATSIAIMALGSVYLRKTEFELTGLRKLGIVFFFGLFHGLGFAGLLRELGVGQTKFVFSLISFNVGIEVGQLIIIALVLPFLLLLRKTPYNALAIKILGTFIGIIGVLWAIERVFGYSIGFLGF
jgi:hydrogenase/urease accessory protein HupE